MSRASFLLAVCVLVSVACPLTVRADDKAVSTAKYSYFISSKSSSGSSGLAAGVLVCEQQSHRPIAWFSAAKPSGEKSHFLYLLIFKTPAGFEGSIGSSVSHLGDGVQGTMTVDVAKEKAEMTYKFVTDRKTHAVLKQSLTVGGQEVKESDPRVFVVDLTSEKATYTPMKVELPKDAPDVSHSDEWGAVVQRAIDQLKKDSPELKKVLDARE